MRNGHRAVKVVCVIFCMSVLLIPSSTYTSLTSVQVTGWPEQKRTGTTFTVVVNFTYRARWDSDHYRVRLEAWEDDRFRDDFAGSEERSLGRLEAGGRIEVEMTIPVGMQADTGSHSEYYIKVFVGPYPRVWTSYRRSEPSVSIRHGGGYYNDVWTVFKIIYL